MANNRLYLHDKKTGDQIMLAKSFGAGWRLEKTAEEIQNWLDGQDENSAYGVSNKSTALKLFTENQKRRPEIK